MFAILNQGGFTMYILLAVSITMVAIIIERYIRLKAASTDTIIFLARLARLMQEGRLGDAMSFCDRSQSAIASVAGAALAKQGRGKEEIKDTLASAITLQQASLTRNLPLIGTIATTAPFIGLFGTVIGIMHAFQEIAAMTGANPGQVSRGISEALINTAAGLGVAIVAVVAYNLFTTWVNRFDVDFEVVSTEVLHLMTDQEATV
ncbi:MAG: MotA/TolQ/ExbB proton channel family protein [Armatimonadetes bacterium]|nr:MotA/TolQ/ExbB proton channel family protein [Armatimonadota bacterium]